LCEDGDGRVGLSALVADEPVCDLVDWNNVHSADQLVRPEDVGVATGQAQHGIDHA